MRRTEKALYYKLKLLIVVMCFSLLSFCSFSSLLTARLRQGPEYQKRVRQSLWPNDIAHNSSKLTSPWLTGIFHGHCDVVEPGVERLRTQVVTSLSLPDMHKSRTTKQLEEKEPFQNWLHKVQFAEEDCGKSNDEVIVFVDDDRTAGFGSRMLRITSAFVSALHKGVPLVYPKVGSWTYSKCMKRSNDCYFLPVSNVKSWIQTPTNISRHTGTFLSSSPKLRRLWTRGSLDAFYNEHAVGVPWIYKVALSGRHIASGRGACWVIGQLLYYLLQPGVKLEKVLQLEKERLGWGQHPVAAIHVRHGDRAQRGHQGSSLQLVDFIKKLSTDAPHVRNILLMTEDHNVVEEARRDFSNFHFYVTEIQPRHNDDINRLLANGLLDPEREIHNALVNLYLAVDSDIFMGHLSSTWGRLVLLLSYGKYGCFQSFNLMGSSWKSRWGFSSCTTAEFTKETRLFPCDL